MGGGSDRAWVATLRRRPLLGSLASLAMLGAPAAPTAAEGWEPSRELADPVEQSTAQLVTFGSRTVVVTYS